MIRLRRYLKPYILMILAAFLFLFGQGMGDLLLPDLMSDIVNVGIQRSGIEHSSPEIISAEGYDMLRACMNVSGQKLFDNSYKKVSTDSSQFRSLKDEGRFPGLSSGSKNVYILKDGADRGKLDDAVGDASFAMIMTAKDIAKKYSGGKTDTFQSQNISDIDISAFYTISKMPGFSELAAPNIIQSEKADKMITGQMGIAFCRMFYNELGINTGKLQTEYIFRIGVIMVLVTIAGAVASIIVSFIASKVSAGVARTIRSDVFKKVESFSNTEFDRFSTASLITRTTNDITQIQNLINMGIRMICYAPIMGIGGAVLAASTTTSMSWIIISAIGLLLAVMIVVLVIALPKFKIMQKLVDRLNLVTRESLSGLLVIRAFGTQRYEEERFDKANSDLTNVNLFINRIMALLMPVMMLIMNGVSMLVIWVGAHQIEQAQIQVGDMMAFIQYSMMIIMSFLMIAVMFILVPRASVSGVRIAEVLECEPSLRDPDAPVSFGEKVRGEVVFENVSFRYEGAGSDALKNISFKAVPGKTTAIIGTTGSGKTTLINLIPRFYDVTSGRVTVDGIDVRDLTQKELRSVIGLVPQKGILFSGTVASNLKYGREDAGTEELEQAAKTAQAEEFILSKPDKYNTPISQGGTNVSGGQKQRLAIARALVKKAPIYILDDSFSALDFKTDSALRKAMKKYTGNSTVIVVAQRISTIMHSDNIIVLDEGRIVGSGNHNDLLENCEEYREIAVSQNSDRKI